MMGLLIWGSNDASHPLSVSLFKKSLIKIAIYNLYPIVWPYVITKFKILQQKRYKWLSCDQISSS